MGLSEAETACKGAKGRLANIYSEEHFHLIRALIRSRTPINYVYNHVWTGLQLDMEVYERLFCFKYDLQSVVNVDSLVTKCYHLRQLKLT